MRFAGDDICRELANGCLALSYLKIDSEHLTQHREIVR